MQFDENVKGILIFRNQPGYVLKIYHPLPEGDVRIFIEEPVIHEVNIANSSVEFGPKGIQVLTTCEEMRRIIRQP